MPNPSKKGPDEPKNYNIPLDGRLHQRLQLMARDHRRSLRQEILNCLENCLVRWELEQETQDRAARDRATAAAAKPRAPIHHTSQRQ